MEGPQKIEQFVVVKAKEFVQSPCAVAKTLPIKEIKSVIPTSNSNQSLNSILIISQIPITLPYC